MEAIYSLLILIKPNIFNDEFILEIINYLTNDITDIPKITNYSKFTKITVNNRTVEINYINNLCISYKLNDKLYRTNGPAYICWYKNDYKYCEKYYLNDKKHRDDGPAITTWYNGYKLTECYYINDVRHRIDGPAIIKWYIKILKPCMKKLVETTSKEQMSIIESQYDCYENLDKLYEKPVCVPICRCIDSNLSNISTYKIITYKTGMREAHYYIDGKIHRVESPAIIKWSNDGLIIDLQYYKEGMIKYGTYSDKCVCCNKTLFKLGLI